MPDEKKCPTCGKPMTENALMGLCPECLLQAGFGTMDTGPEAAGKPVPFVPPMPEDLARYFPEMEIIELLGRGGMGAVYKARQKRLERLVAIKILPPNVGQDPSFADRFEREAKALAQLHHPNIVTLYDSGQVDGLFYFFMEFVDGMNLRQLLDMGHISPKEALAIVPQICDALQFAHDRGIIHRDIKPENILLNKEGHVKIADFGVAKIVAHELLETTEKSGNASELGQTEAGKVMGTPQYMAPEQRTNPQDVDNRADIYALGVVFYQMLTGELPAGKFEPPSHKVQVDVRLDEVVLRALEKEPDLRYQQASVMKTQVETIVGTSDTSRTVGAVSTAAVQSTQSRNTNLSFQPVGEIRSGRFKKYFFSGLVLIGFLVIGIGLRKRQFTQHQNAMTQVTQMLSADIVTTLNRANIQYDNLSVGTSSTDDKISCTLSNPRMLKDIHGSKVVVPIQGALEIQSDGAGGWIVQGTGDLEGMQITYSTNGTTTTRGPNMTDGAAQPDTATVSATKDLGGVGRLYHALVYHQTSSTPPQLSPNSYQFIADIPNNNALIHPGLVPEEMKLADLIQQIKLEKVDSIVNEPDRSTESTRRR